MNCSKDSTGKEEQDKEILSESDDEEVESDANEEDASFESFALVPKIEIEFESSAQTADAAITGDAAVADKVETVETRPSLCLFCVKSSHPWSKGAVSNVAKIVSDFCGLLDLDLPASEVLDGGVFGKAGYCSQCQKQLKRLSSLCREMEELRSRIADLKRNILTTVELSLSSPGGRRTKAKVNRSFMDGDEVGRILWDRIRSDAFSSSIRLSTDRNDKHHFRPSFLSNSSKRTTFLATVRKKRVKSVYKSQNISSPKEESSGGTDIGSGKQKLDVSDDVSEVKRVKMMKEEDNTALGLGQSEDEGRSDSETPKYDPSLPFALQKMKKKVAQADDKVVKCEICTRGFEDDCRKKAHVRRYHEGHPLSFFCEHKDCPKRFKRYAELQSHILDHTGETPYNCDLCGNGFKLIYQLKNHQQHVHFSEQSRRFQCGQCDKRFIFQCDLKKHLKTHLETKEQPFICELCGKGYTSGATLKKHKLAKHSDGDNPFKCEYNGCQKEFGTKQDLMEHQYSHTKDWPFFCPQCGLGVATEYRLNRHVELKHGSGYECKICSKRIHYLTSLKTHMLIHSDAPVHTFSCDQCGKTFKYKHLLITHKQTQHVKERLFQCQECDKRFNSKQYLRMHMKNSHRDVYYRNIEERKRRLVHSDFLERESSSNSRVEEASVDQAVTITTTAINSSLGNSDGGSHCQIDKDVTEFEIPIATFSLNAHQFLGGVTASLVYPTTTTMINSLSESIKPPFLPHQFHSTEEFTQATSTQQQEHHIYNIPFHQL